MIVKFIEFEQRIFLLPFLTQSFLRLCWCLISNGHKFHKIYLLRHSFHHLILKIYQLCWISSNSMLWNLSGRSERPSLLLMRIINHKGNVLILILLSRLISTDSLRANKLSRTSGWLARLQFYRSFPIFRFAKPSTFYILMYPLWWF